MKKFFTFLMMLFAFVGAVSAQAFVEPVTGGFYKLKGDNSTKPWLTNTNKSGGKSIVVSTNESEAAIFLKTENGLKDVATGKYIGMNGSNISMVDTETAITLDEKQGNGKYRVKVNTNYMYNNNTDGIVHESSGWIENIERYWGFVEVTEGEYTINTSTGTFSGSGNYRNEWNYTRTLINPVKLTLTSDANNMNSHNGLIQLHSGTNKSSTYTLKVPEGYTIISYSFDYAFGNSGTNDKKFVIGEDEYAVTAEAQSLIVKNINANSTQFVLSGNNQPVKMSNFIVKIQHSTPGIIAQMKEVVIAEVESNSAKLKDALGYYSYTVNGEKVYNANDVKAAVNAAENAEDVITIKHSFALDTPQVGKYYRIKAYASGKYLDAVNRYSGNQMGMKTVAERDSKGSIFLLDEGNRLKNLGTGTYIKETYNIGATKAQANTWTFEASPRTLGCLLVKSNYSSPYLHDNNGRADRCDSDAGHATHDFVLEEVVLVNYILTDKAGNTYTAENVEGTIGVAPVFTGVEGYKLENGTWNGNTYTATITFPFEVSSETQANPILICQDTKVTKKLWTVAGNSVNVVNDEPLLGAAQWMIYPSLNGTEFSFKIKSVSADKFVTASNGSVILTPDGTSFKYVVTPCAIRKTYGLACTNNEDETLYITNNSDPETEDKTPLSLTEVAADEYNYIQFPEMKDFKVVIGDARYTTIYSPFPVYNFTTAKVYTIAEQEVVNNKVQLTEMSYYIPKGGAAILKGEPGEYVFVKTDDNQDMNADWEQNKLNGSSVNTYVKGEAYVLSAKYGIGLYKAELNMNAAGVKVGTPNGDHFLNNAGKAYLPATAISTSSMALRFDFGGETTAIESVLDNGADANAPIYDLSGRRVVNAVKGGIYIQNGKKFIVK